MDIIQDRLFPSGDTLLLVLSIMRYFMMILLLITMFMQPEGSTTFTMLLGGAIVLLLMDSIWAFSTHENSASARAWLSHNNNMGSFLVRAVAFTLPMFVAGGTKNKKSRAPAIFAAIVGIIYFVGAWAGYQM